MTPHPTPENQKWLVAALYKFVDQPNFTDMQSPIAENCRTNGVVGTILLAREGINGTISGPEPGVRAFLAWLTGWECYVDLDIKESWSNSAPFYRMKVRLKKEIVTLGAGQLDPANNAGRYVDPEDWNALISDPDIVLIDTRNDYEVAIGTFDSAIDPKTASFRNFPEWVDENLKPIKHRKVAMFCTGGIRCEKSTALLKSKGFDEVYHLKGGILKYLETVPEEQSLWKGECFVFDQRVSVGHGLVEGSYDQCHACRMPLTLDEKKTPQYIEGISCLHCFGEQSSRQNERFRERQKQMALAKTRGQKHIAADIATAKRQKRQLMSGKCSSDRFLASAD